MGAKFYALDKKDGTIKWEFDTGKGRYFSPGVCWPFIKHGNIFIQSSDYFIRAFNPNNGDIVWQTKEPKGRESIDISNDSSTLYIKGINNWISAFDLNSTTFSLKWRFFMPYKENFIPTSIQSSKNIIYIASGYGTVYALKSDGSKLMWQHKISNSAISSFNCLKDGSVIVCTMDGKIVHLK